MAERLIRLGRVSKIDYENGMISVTYPDMDDAVTGFFPVLSFTGEYKMPKIGEEVLVLHLSNGQSAGIVLGRYFNKDNKPAVHGANTFRKELSENAGEAYIQYKDGKISFHDPGGTTTLDSLIDRITALERRL